MDGEEPPVEGTIHHLKSSSKRHPLMKVATDLAVDLAIAVGQLSLGQGGTTGSGIGSS
jgi:hypothetical protein